MRTVFVNVIHQPKTLSVRFPTTSQLAVGVLDMDGSLTGVQETYLTSQASTLALQGRQTSVLDLDVQIKGAADACLLDEVGTRLALN